MQTIIKNKTIYDAIFSRKNIFLDIGMMVSAVIILAVLANLYIPLWPVPITGQTLGIFLIAFFFGSLRGSLTIILYIVTGILGIGVFAQHKSGIAVMLGPTGGYILGFLIAALLVGLMIEKGYGRKMKSVLLVMVIGNIIIYLFGVIGLRLYFADFSWLKIMMVGVIPFLIGDAIKIVIAISLFPYLWKKADRLA